MGHPAQGRTGRGGSRRNNQSRRGVLPAPNAGQGRIYFYRPRGSLFPAVEPDVIVNDRKVGVSVQGEAFYRDAYPGDYEIFLTSDQTRIIMPPRIRLASAP